MLAIAAESPVGIARIQGSVNGVSIFNQAYGNTSPVTASQFLDFAQLPNGSHTLGVVVTDGDGGQTALNVPFTLNLSAPPAPTITRPANGAKCARCWKVLPTVGSDSEHPDLCPRCAAVVKKLPVIE